MRAVDLIRKKRDGLELAREDIQFLIDGATSGRIPDYQLTAWLMAVVWRGLSRAELAALTETMLHSGIVVDFSDLPGAKVDKHSTGGVGDKTSLVIAPVVAAAGVYVPMISGRGLGHTGGTLDKLESIPGFNVNLPLNEFRRTLEECRCALIGQTPEIAPADKKLYALRDVTATVESPYLICASIMSKKLAEGIDSLVLDVKTGDGAFMKNEADAIYLAELMVETGTRVGKNVVALITDMEQPLGRKIGNALEVEECLEVLSGGGPEDLKELCLELSAWMLLLGRRAATREESRAIASRMVSSGLARDKFRQVIQRQGGDPAVVDHPERLPKARHTETIRSGRDGFVQRIRSQDAGAAAMLLGGGREKKEDAIDPAVGIVLEKKVGDRVAANEPLCVIHHNSDARLAEARGLIEQCFVIGPKAPAPAPLVRKIIGAGTQDAP
jgi:pyrimidine-nucleoside phosphorylase